MKYVCKVCGYVYDEEQEGVPFDTLPEDWRCPVCTAAKGAFEPEAAAAPVPEAKKAAPAPEELDIPVALSAGELAALCSNLARGCEKQYEAEAAALFRELADYFAAAAPAVPESEVAALAAELRADLNERYPALRAAAAGAGDRGTLRVCTWGEKVTNMLSSLLEMYDARGETLFEGKQLWLCTVCGFVYLGAQPPKLCPVCKVPEWKFERVEGRRS